MQRSLGSALSDVTANLDHISSRLPIPSNSPCSLQRPQFSFCAVPDLLDDTIAASTFRTSCCSSVTDYICISSNFFLLMLTVSMGTHSLLPTGFTDHCLILCSLDSLPIIHSRSRTQNKSKRIYHVVFNFSSSDNMTWDDLNVSFSKALASVLFSPFHPRTLDHVWHAFKSNLFVCFHDHLPKRHISPVSPSTLPREQFTMMLQLKLLNHLKKELLSKQYQFNVSFHSASFTNFKRAFEAREDNFLHKQGQFITSAINRDRSIGPSQSPYKSLSSLPLRWSSRYQPVDLLSDDIYDSVISLISLDKFCSTIRTLPCGKAAGPSGIPYEAFKHLSENNLSWLLRLFNDCLLTGNIPTEWRNASIYPIPKPTQFDGLLKNT
ncbi:hypothetical protein RclHR1_01220002 [Rhizophagus clarus]|uniref:Reverse transcriptase domain-containing protein n=1 Tax=Rhizophagus clarus TaxID=94130 RepID=A0A2Z6QZE6_9GLOM|nr:hypothetical protein RclHR1_01220002 [Rhizophagus clarus]